MGSGTLQINSANAITLTSLNLGASSKLVVTADPAAGKATELDVTAGSGTATIADGAKLALRLTSIGGGVQTFTLIRANQLTAGAIDTSFLGSTPYLYNASLAATSGANGTVTLTLSRKTAAELQLDGSIAGAYEPVIAAINSNAGLSQGLLAPTDRAGFTAAYNQLLPEHSGGIFQLVRAGVEAFGRPLDDRQAPEGGGAWVQEVNVGAYAQTRDSLPGYKAWGVGLIGGFEAPATRVGVFGATIGGFSGELRPRESDANDNTVANVVEVGGYWRATLGQVALNARVGGDYLTATGHRVVNFASDGQTLFDATATGHWTGWGVTSRVRASYEARLGNSLYLRPQLGVDYLRLSEGAYTEGGGGAIDLAVDGRTTSELAGFAGLAVGAVFGEQGASWGPELLLGYRDVVAKNDGTTTARFLTGGDSFTVGPNPISGGGGVARMALKSESAWGAVSIEGGAEARDSLTVYDLKLAVHLLF
jgi:outer membrane autotransporter protein